MKKLALAAVFALPALVLAASHTEHESRAAAPPSGAPTTGPTGTIPQPKIDLAPSVKGIFFAGGGTQKNDAPLSPLPLELHLKNHGNVAKQGTLTVRAGALTIASGPFALAGGEAKTVPFFDNLGFQGPCQSPITYDTKLQGEGFVTESKARVSKACTYGGQVKNPWNMLPPDRVWEQSQNRVYYNTLNVGASLTCGGSMTFTAPVKNNTDHAVSGIMLEVLYNGAVKGKSDPISIAAGASKIASVSIHFQGDPGAYKTRLVDPQNTANGAITGSGAAYEVERTCNLTIDPVL
jgi:hypothetical protein